MSITSSKSRRYEAIAGILAGLLLAFVAWVSSGAPGALVAKRLSQQQADFARRSVPVAAAILPTATATPPPPADCTASDATITQDGFDPYAILARKRGDVLWFYAKNGWNPATQCQAIFDDWTKHGADSKTPTTPAAYVRAQGWAPVVPEATPAPPADCVAPAQEVARLGFDPYQILAVHRIDVLHLYQANGWKPDTQCVQIFNDWLKHPDGGPPTSAAAFVIRNGWASGLSASESATPRPSPLPMPKSATEDASAAQPRNTPVP